MPELVAPSRRRTLARAVLALVAFALAAELALALVPRYWSWRAHLADAGGAAASGRVVVVGDSVSAGFGVYPGLGWPSQMVTVLQARGVEWVGLENRASPATTAASAASEIGSAPISGAALLVMIGHNDFVVWRNIVNQRQTIDRGLVPADLVPYLPRLLRLGWYAVAGDVASSALDDTTVAKFRRSMGQVLAAARRSGATPVLLTYAVPGEPTEQGPSGGVEAGRVVRETQMAVNQVIRTAAAEEDVLLVDVEREVPSSADWSSDEYLDVIHPTAATHRRIGEAVADALIEAGLVKP